MPSHTQRTVDLASSTERALGPRLSTHGTAQLQRLFPASPIHSEELSREERRSYFQREVLDARINDGGHTFGTFDTSYSGAPNMAEVDLARHNLPSPYFPNPVSPGPGSQNDSDKAAVNPADYAREASDTYGTGDGSQLSPHAAAGRIAASTLPGTLAPAG